MLSAGWVDHSLAHVTVVSIAVHAYEAAGHFVKNILRLNIQIGQVPTDQVAGERLGIIQHSNRGFHVCDIPLGDICVKCHSSVERVVHIFDRARIPLGDIAVEGSNQGIAASSN